MIEYHKYIKIKEIARIKSKIAFQQKNKRLKPTVLSAKL